MTSQVEEKELDANKVHTAMAGLLASQRADREAQRLRCADMIVNYECKWSSSHILRKR